MVCHLLIASDRLRILFKVCVKVRRIFKTCIGGSVTRPQSSRPENGIEKHTLLHLLERTTRRLAQNLRKLSAGRLSLANKSARSLSPGLRPGGTDHPS